MTLPVTANRHQPALAVIRSGAQMWERANRLEAPNSIPGMTTQSKAPAQPKDMQAINEFYFGTSITASEAMFAIFEKLVGYLNSKLEVGRDGDEKSIAVGNKWRDQALLGHIEVGSEKDFSIPKPGEGGTTFRSVASMLRSMFNTGFLDTDRKLKTLLEETLGFSLNGISISDLIDAFVDPDSDAAKRISNAIADGVAGQAGSKVQQRLQDAAEGPKSVEELSSGQGKSSIEYVDEETVAEDQQALAMAKVRDKLEKAAELPERVNEALESADQENGAAKPVDPTAAATATIQALTGLATTTAPEQAPEVTTPKMDPSQTAATAAPAEDASGKIDIVANEGVAELALAKPSGTLRPEKDKSEDFDLRGVLRHYLDFIKSPGADFENRPQFVRWF